MFVLFIYFLEKKRGDLILSFAFRFASADQVHTFVKPYFLITVSLSLSLFLAPLYGQSRGSGQGSKKQTHIHTQTAGRKQQSCFNLD